MGPERSEELEGQVRSLCHSTFVTEPRALRLLGPVDPSFQTFSGRLKLTVPRRKSIKNHSPSQPTEFVASTFSLSHDQWSCMARVFRLEKNEPAPV